MLGDVRSLGWLVSTYRAVPTGEGDLSTRVHSLNISAIEYKAKAEAIVLTRQSSWLYTLAFEIVICDDEPTSKASVLWPPAESPALLSMVMEFCQLSESSARPLRCKLRTS